MRQSIGYQQAQDKIDAAFAGYCKLIRDDVWSLSHAHWVLQNMDQEKLTLFDIAGLAKAIAVFQCETE